MNAQNPEKKTGTILFCDIRNFTSLFDEKDPFEAVQFANTVLTVLGEVVENTGGTVDRFTGDGFLAHFGFTHEAENHAELACKTAIGIRKKLLDINTQRYLNTEMVVAVGIGIHSGVAAYCEIETNNFKQITVLGDSVNTAARIEELTKFFVLDVLTSEETFELVKDQFKFQAMPEKTLRGKKKAIKTYWLLPLNQ